MDTTEIGSVILIQMVLPRRIFILVSGTRGIYERNRLQTIITMIHISYSDLACRTPKKELTKKS